MGTYLLLNKTPPNNKRRRNKKSCAADGRITGIPLVVEPVAVPVPLTVRVPVEIKDVAVTVRIVKNRIKYLPHHRLLNTLKAESYS
jgi:hypothetical protein